MLYPKGLRLRYLVMPKKINASLFATQFFAHYAYYREALLKLWITQVQCKWIVYQKMQRLALEKTRALPYIFVDKGDFG